MPSIDIRRHRKLNFEQAVMLACEMCPGLANDMKITLEMGKNQPRDMEGIGRLGVIIPDPIMPLMEAYFPDLFQPDVLLANAAWVKWMKTSDAKWFKAGTKL